MDDSTETAIEQPSAAATPGTCACGCGGAVTPGKTWLQGHHNRGRSEATPPDDVTLVALTPADMVPAQADLSAWCDRKIAAVKAELADMEVNLELATEHGWKYPSVAASMARIAKRVLYYEKLKTAVDAGYVIVPNFPVNIFAVRVKRRKQAARTSTFAGSSDFRARPELLPVGEGRYVDETVFTSKEIYEEKDRDGKLVTRIRYLSGDYDNVDFPVVVLKPTILDATKRAMTQRIFDQMGIAQNTSGRDPIIVGQILDPRGGGRLATFFVAWWLNTADL